MLTFKSTCHRLFARRLEARFCVEVPLFVPDSGKLVYGKAHICRDCEPRPTAN